MTADELKAFFSDLGATLTKAITPEQDPPGDPPKKKGDGDPPKANGGDPDDSTEGVAKRLVLLEKAILGEDEGSLMHAIKAQVADNDGIREILDATLETVNKLATASTVRKAVLDDDPKDDGLTEEQRLSKSNRDSEVGLGNALIAAANGARIRLT